MFTRHPYELWANTGNSFERVGSYSSIKQLQKAWLSSIHSSLEARNVVGDKTYVVNDRMPQRLLQTLVYQSAEGRDKYMEENAQYFTVVRFLGRGKYERHKRATKEEAVKLGNELSLAHKGNYMVYAVGPNNQSAYIETITYKTVRK
jgi:hypothetical protein